MRISDWSSDVCSSDLPRLGSPYCFNPFEAAELKAQGLPERCYPAARAGLTVIDTTDVSRGSTGHSNFLRSPVACRAFIDVVAGKRPRPERVATQWAHVFRLIPDHALPDERATATCHRTPEAEPPDRTTVLTGKREA